MQRKTLPRLIDRDLVDVEADIELGIYLSRHRASGAPDIKNRTTQMRTHDANPLAPQIRSQQTSPSCHFAVRPLG